MMRKIGFMAAAAALIVTGCTNDSLVPDQKGSNTQEVSFRGILEKGATSKASVIERSSELTSFFVHAAKYSEDGYLNEGFDFMEAAVYYNGVNWAYTPTKYWPTGDDNVAGIDFFAYAPIKDVNMDNSFGRDDEDVSFTYTVPFDQSGSRGDGANTAVDLLVASMNVDENNFGQEVSLQFKHALSAVNFSAVQRTYKDVFFHVESIYITGLHNAGTFTYDYSDYVGEWSDGSGSGDYEAGIPYAGVSVYYTEAEENYGDAVKLLSVNDLMMVLPQEFVVRPVSQDLQVSASLERRVIEVENAAGTSPKVCITYNAKYGDGTTVWTTSQTSKLSFPDIYNNGKFAFEQGSRYNFLIEFAQRTYDPNYPGIGPGTNLEPVIFVAKVDEWGDDSIRSLNPTVEN